MTILAQNRGRSSRTAVIEHPAWLARQVNRSVPVRTAARYLLRDRDAL
jgi:hypothetical protein